MVTCDVLKVLENFLNTTHAHKSRNARASLYDFLYLLHFPGIVFIQYYTHHKSSYDSKVRQIVMMRKYIDNEDNTQF